MTWIPNTTDLSLPRMRLMDLVAACPTFRTVVGAADSVEAMEHIFSPYAPETLVPELDVDDEPLTDPAGKPIKVLSNARPRCTINLISLNRKLLGSSFAGSTGLLELNFEFLPVAEAGEDKNLQLAMFEEQVGLIFMEMEARRGKDKLAGEAIFTEPEITHLQFTEWEIVDGPAEGHREEEQDELFYGVTTGVAFV